MKAIKPALRAAFSRIVCERCLAGKEASVGIGKLVSCQEVGWFERPLIAGGIHG
jgi:hypothetical protein